MPYQALILAGVLFFVASYFGDRRKVGTLILWVGGLGLAVVGLVLGAMS